MDKFRQAVLEWLRWLWQRLGWRAALGIGPIVVGLVVWWNWKDIRERPGIQAVVDQFAQEPLPQADPRKFITITHLNGNLEQEIEKLVHEAVQAGDSTVLTQAVVIYRTALLDYIRKQIPLKWATTQINLETALSTLDEQKARTARLEEVPKPPVEWLAQIMEWLRWVWQQFGGWAALGIVPVIVGLVVWWNWKDIRERPGIQALVAWFKQEPLPQADPGKFNLALTHLNGDSGQEIEKLVYEALSEVAGGSIQVLRFDRLIPVEGSDSSRLNQQGHSQARQLLGISRAEAVIWGTVLRSGQTAVPELHWTVNKTLEGLREVGRYPITAADLDLPPMGVTFY